MQAWAGVSQGSVGEFLGVMRVPVEEEEGHLSNQKVRNPKKLGSFPVKFQIEKDNQPTVCAARWRVQFREIE